jgi:hypothetical protein
MYSLVLPFRLRERKGRVLVRVEASDDPDDLGLPLVAVGYERDAFVGFPILEARVNYEGRGPRAWMGWLQVITRLDADGTRTEEADADPLVGDGWPLYTFGYAPTLSDCPANPGHPDGDWTADAYLVAIPDVMRTRVLAPITGFRWGYRLEAGSPPSVFEPRGLSDETWEEHRRHLLAPAYPAWTFLPSGTQI